MKSRLLKIIAVFSILAVVFILIAFSGSYQDNNGNKSVTIGTQVWMVQNLDISTFRNGDPIPQAKTDEEWDDAKWESQPAWCYFDFDPSNGEKYGRLYNWFAVNDPRGLAPEGWHVPGDEEWDALQAYLIKGLAGKKMKSTGGWKENGNGTNSSGFTGLPSGYRDFEGFHNMGAEAYWWSSTASDSKWTSCRYIDYSEPYLHKHNMSKGDGLSVRCIRD
jgi:uncharacterized protein (TIGR02145 family)